MSALVEIRNLSKVYTRGRQKVEVLHHVNLDIAAGRGLEQAVIQSTQIGAVNSWLRNQQEEIVSAAIASVREALAPYADGASVRLPGAMWLISSAPA